MIVGLICQPSNRVVIEVCASSRLRPLSGGIILDDFALDFDVIPYDSVIDTEFAEA